jgi:two-component system sensor histidine kinase/response regulator
MKRAFYAPVLEGVWVDLKMFSNVLYCLSAKGGDLIQSQKKGDVYCQSSRPDYSIQDTMSQTKPKGNILIVDDVPANLKVLTSMLTEQGYQVRPAINGQVALTAVRETPPDLILLDIVMPGMDGYEVCERLKADEQTRDIPIIFISALDATGDKVNAFTAGGVDYVPKPFQVEEVLARINTHLTLRNLQRSLQEQIAELDAFAHTVAHDLKNPLTAIIGYSDLLYNHVSELEPEKLETVGHGVHQAACRAVNIIEELLLLAGVRKRNVELMPLDMACVVGQAQERLKLMIAQYQGEIILPETWPVSLGYAPWIGEVWINYLSNGLKYSGKPPRLELGATPQADGMIRFWVKDNGPGLTPEAQATLFTEFTRLDEVRAKGHGLGLSIVRRIMDKLGGQVGVESEIGQGSVFYFTLPGAEENGQGCMG